MRAGGDWGQGRRGTACERAGRCECLPLTRACSVLVDRVAAARDIEDLEHEKRQEESKRAFREHAAAKVTAPPAKKQATMDCFLGNRSAVR